MRGRRALIFATVALLVPGLALAEGFATRDLGDGGTPDACMFRAQRALNALTMESQNAQAVVATGRWTVDIYNLQPGNVDVQVACPYRDDYVGVVLITAHSEGAEQDRLGALDSVEGRWNATGQSGEVRDQVPATK